MTTTPPAAGSAERIAEIADLRERGFNPSEAYDYWCAIATLRSALDAKDAEIARLQLWEATWGAWQQRALAAEARLAAADSHAGEPVTWERLARAHSAMLGTEPWKGQGPNEGHRIYRQDEKEACYMCAALRTIRALEARLAQANEAGTVVVPRDPTPEMVEAIRKAMSPEKFVSHMRAMDCWEAGVVTALGGVWDDGTKFVSTSPTPSAQSAGGEEEALLWTALTDLVRALDSTNWSSWQSTARFAKEIEAARAAIVRVEK